MMPRRFCVLLIGLTLVLVCKDVSAADSLHRRIDQLIAAKAKTPLFPRSGDEEFVRRVFLDLAGRIPTVDELNEFLSEDDTNKRAVLIDRLLAGKDYPRRMQELFHAILMERRGDDEHWLKFLRSAFEANRPWDEMVRAILIPDTENKSANGAAFFFTQRLVKEGAMAPVDVPALTRDVGRMFAGVDLQCAQCHDHVSIDDYRQRDFQGLHMVFENVTARRDLEFPAVSERLLSKKKEYVSVFTLERTQTALVVPGGGKIEIPVPVKGEEYLVPPDRKKRTPGIPKFSPLRELAQSLTGADNVLFCNNIVNRLWFVMMGRGLVEPLDLHHSANPPSHPELLKLLASEFGAHEFDIKWLLKEYALTETYQRTSLLAPGDEAPRPRTFALANEKRLSAEQLFWSTLVATGELDRRQQLQRDQNGKNKESTAEPAVVVAEELVLASEELQLLRQQFVAAFANAPKVPEVGFEPTVKSALFLLHGKDVLSLLARHPKNLVDRLSKVSDTNQLAEQLFLSILSRKPNDEERTHAVQFLEKNDGDALRQLAWAMLASTEYCLNH